MNTLVSRIKTLDLSFWLIVAFPTVVSIIYFGLIASDRYVSVSNFVVRSPQKSTGVTGLSAILQNVGFSRSTDDSYVVNDYVLSRDAVNALQKDLSIKDRYSNSKVDLFSRFNPLGMDGSAESFYEYYKGKVSINLESASSISTLTVKAYTPEDALAINQKLLEQAESLVNKLNERGRKDMVVSAEENVKQAENRVREAADRLAQYRATNQVFDVDKQATVQMQLVSKLQDQLILVGTQLAQVRAVTPENPQIQVLMEREKAIKKEIAKETQKALGNGAGSLNQKAVEYERLTLEKDVATKQWASMLATLEQSKIEAEKKQLYLERISEPQKPDSAVEPKRLKGVFSVFVLSLFVLGIFKMLLAGLREHKE